jgi:hypothetical protein
VYKGLFILEKWSPHKDNNQSIRKEKIMGSTDSAKWKRGGINVKAVL